MKITWLLTLLLFVSICMTTTVTEAADGTETLVPVPEKLASKAPAPRTLAEVNAMLKGAKKLKELRPIHIVLVAGKKDHGPGEHDYPAFQKSWEKLLSRAINAKVTTAWEKPGEADLKSADVMVFFKRGSWPKELNEQMARYFARGGGAVLLHYAVDGNQNPQVCKHIGLCWGRGSRYRHGWLDLDCSPTSRSPILRNFAGKKVRFHDESYWRLHGDATGNDVLATCVEKEKEGNNVTVPLLWNRRSGKGRVNVNILGHYNWTFNDPLFRILLLRSIAWAAGEPVDRFNSLVLCGVKLKE